MRFIFTLVLATMAVLCVHAQTITIDLPLQANNSFGSLKPTNSYDVSRLDCGAGTLDFSLFENTSTGSACPGSVVITATIYVDRDLGSSPLGPFDLGVPITPAQVPDGSHTARLTAVDDCGGSGTLDYTLVVVSEDYSGNPACIPPARVDIDCTDLLATYGTLDINGLSASQLDADFGTAIGVDPCVGGLTVSQTIAGATNVCGIGSYTRSFTVTNQTGNPNPTPCRQIIFVALPGICDCPNSDYTLTPNEPDFRDGSYHLDWYDCDGTQNFSFSEPGSSSGCTDNDNFFTLYLDQDPDQLFGNYFDGDVVSPAIPAGTHTVLLIQESGCGDAVIEYTLTVNRIDGNNLSDIVLSSQEEVNLFIRQWSYGSCSGLPGNLTIDDGTTGRSVNAGTPINDLSGFSAIAPLSVGGDLIIGATSNLTTLAGMESISSVAGNIEITDNSALNDIAALATAAAAGTTMVSLSNNPMLTVCGNPTLCTASDNGAGINLDPANPNCDTPAEFETACQVLPVNFLYFTGRVSGKQVFLTWATAQEENNLGFYVERATSLQTTWMQVSFVPSEGQAGSYEFSDEAPETGTNLYRLRQVDVSGEESYSNIINLTFSGGQLVVYPNPVRDELRLGLPQNEVEQVRILNAQGQEVRLKHKVSTVFVADLPAGIYYVEVQAAGRELLLQRVVIAR